MFTNSSKKQKSAVEKSNAASFSNRSRPSRLGAKDVNPDEVEDVELTDEEKDQALGALQKIVEDNASSDETPDTDEASSSGEDTEPSEGDDSSEEKEEDGDAQEGGYKCKECEESFKYAIALYGHKRKHESKSEDKK